MNAANLFRHSFSVKNIQHVFNTKLLGTRAIGLDRTDAEKFESQLVAECEIISRKVLAGTYNFTAYKEKLISKGSGKAPRQLAIPTIRDRLTLRVVCNLLFEIFPNAKPLLPQDQISKVRSAISSGKYSNFVKIDLKEFYPSIDHKLLMRRIGRKTRLNQFKGLIHKSLVNPVVAQGRSKGSQVSTCGVAQGLSVSNVLAEIFMQDIDAKLANSEIAYCRFVDDILILTSDDPEKLCEQVCKVLRQSKLNPHSLKALESKTRVGKISDGFDFLGYQMAPGKIGCREKTVLGFESSIVEVFADYAHRNRAAKTAFEKEQVLFRFRWALNLKITGCIYKNRRFGWIFYYSQIDDTSIFRRIDKTVEKLIQRFDVAIPPKPKTLVKSFHEAKRSNKTDHRYIPNYDEMDVAKMKDLLRSIGQKVDSFNNVEVSLAFHRLIRKATQKLDKDIAHMS